MCTTDDDIWCGNKRENIIKRILRTTEMKTIRAITKYTLSERQRNINKMDKEKKKDKTTMSTE